ncbi:MAG: hypothetical protein HY675_23465 [Chloroflexi bacterium]|nr:hypothetical protein [Chloroflexota bacterium]
MNVAEAISRILVAEGVGIASGISGMRIGEIGDALVSDPQIKLCYARHERGAVDICDGYARVTGRPGVVFADSGPAVANAMAGIVNSYGDSVPLLFLAGQQERFEVPRRATKELAIRDLYRPVSNWATAIIDPRQVEHVLRRAFVMFNSGRPGPVVVEIPSDVAAMEALPFSSYRRHSRIRSAGDPEEIVRAVRALGVAERPYVYVGSGVLAAEATDELVELAELLSLPVATTLNGKSSFPEDHALSLGIGGFSRAPYSSFQSRQVAEAADLVLTIGCGLKREGRVAPMPKGVIHIQVDVDPFELHKEVDADFAILGDAKLVLRQMIDTARAELPAARLQPRAELLDSIQRARQEWMAVSEPFLTSREKPINPFRVTWELAQIVDPAQTILLPDVGSVRGTTCQHYVATKPRSFVGFGVESAMGWSIGAAIGAKVAAPDKLVISVLGDEAFGETGLELETAVCSEVPILLILKNNRADRGLEERVSPKLSPVRFKGGQNYAMVARDLGAWATRVEDPEALREALAEAVKRVQGGECALVEVVTKRVAPSLHRLYERR